MDIIINVYSGHSGLYYGKFTLTRIDKGLVWLYILGSSLEKVDNAYPLLRKIVLIEQDSNYYHTYFYFEESDLEQIK